MIIEYVEEQLTFGKPKESIHRELLLSGFDEESIHLVTEVAAINCHERDSNRRSKDLNQGSMILLAGVFMLMLNFADILGNSSQFIAGLLIISGGVLLAIHLPAMNRFKPVLARIRG